MTPRVGPIAAQRARNALLAEQAAQIVARDVLAHATPSGRAAIESAGSADNPLPVVLLPANSRGTVALPAASRDAFLQRLRPVIAQAFTEAVRDNTAPMSLAEVAARDDARGPDPTSASSGTAAMRTAILGASCATCRGECCTAGGTHAFLREDTVRRVRAQYAEDARPLTTRALEELYARHLPARHYRDSCVYHTTSGCALPRDLRANLCNRYVCGGLTQLSRALDAAGHETAYVAAADSAHLRRVARVSGEGVRTVSLTVRTRASPGTVAKTGG